MSASDFVVLPGLVLPIAAVRLALDLEERGLHMHADGEFLSVGPRELLTDADRVELRRWKQHLLAMLAYDADKGPQ